MFRGCLAAAPLKHAYTTHHASQLSSMFRGCLAAAPLKRADGVLEAERDVQMFRGCLAAAPLKQGGPGQPLVGVAAHVPRLFGRGSIEAPDCTPTARTPRHVP